MKNRKLASKILFIISVVLYTGLTIFFLIYYIKALLVGLNAKANGENDWLLMVAFLLTLLVYGGIGYFLVLCLNITGLILVNVKKEEKRLYGKKHLTFIILPLLTFILFIISVMIAT